MVKVEETNKNGPAFQMTDVKIGLENKAKLTDK